MSTHSTSVNGLFQREPSDILLPHKLLQIAAQPSSVFIVLHNGWPLVVNGQAASKGGLSLLKLNYSAVASVLTEHNLIYLGSMKSQTDVETLSTSNKILQKNNNHSSVAHFCIDVSKLSTDEVMDLRSDSIATELIHPFSFVRLLSEDRLLYSRALPILDWHRKNQFCPTCGSATSMANGGYKRICQNVDCLTHKGHNSAFIFVLELMCFEFTLCVQYVFYQVRKFTTYHFLSCQLKANHIILSSLL